MEEHHSTEKEIWLVHYKKHTGKAVIPYEDEVEEAICFGWIDGQVRRIDEETYARRYTPRTERSKWSETNKQRARKMIEEGKMTKTGMEKLGNALNEPPEPQRINLDDIPTDMKKALKADEMAWKNFSSFAPGYRRNYIEWVMDAKREETRARRINSVVERARENKRPGMM
ncbi:YdeI/OmpD-associated family protein [Methanococcoides sp. FTZ1]|uniref:YdeI/OmpD-associated family protein n=1 Tax=Methanococcoides sp. FTZ1 TaxID=3439061 RepID=UPI003F862D59